jgi:hypothetical protein
MSGDEVGLYVCDSCKMDVMAKNIHDDARVHCRRCGEMNWRFDQGEPIRAWDWFSPRRRAFFDFQMQGGPPADAAGDNAGEHV